jgi:hypothetical protein
VVRIVLTFISYAFYLSLLLLVWLLISSFVERSSIALALSTFAWFFFVTIIPNVATMVPDFVGDGASVYQRVGGKCPGPAGSAPGAGGAQLHPDAEL